MKQALCPTCLEQCFYQTQLPMARIGAILEQVSIFFFFLHCSLCSINSLLGGIVTRKCTRSNCTLDLKKGKLASRTTAHSTMYFSATGLLPKALRVLIQRYSRTFSSIDFLIIHKEPTRGFVQLLYETIAVMKTGSGLPVFTFWDKQCLNDGQNWQNGFLKGLQSSKVIILLISNKVCALFFITCIFLNSTLVS